MVINLSDKEPKKRVKLGKKTTAFVVDVVLPKKNLESKSNQLSNYRKIISFGFGHRLIESKALPRFAVAESDRDRGRDGKPRPQTTTVRNIFFLGH